MIEKQVVIDRIEILEDGQIQVRTTTRIIEDGEELMHTYSRKVLAPGADVTGEAKRVSDVSAVVWTPEVVSAYQAKQIV